MEDQFTIPKQWIPSLKQISVQAGAAILEIYNGDDFGIESKSDNSPLTRADKASNAVICDGLKALTPDIPIISEENVIPAYEVRKSYETYWLLDPLDGTKEFIKRNGDFTTNIALIHQNKPILGFVYAPTLNKLYWAGQSMGAYLVENGNEKPISVKSFKTDQEGLTITCSRSHLNSDTEEYIARYTNPVLHKVGSSLKLMMVAEGKAHLYPRLGPISEWDIAASHIIVEEAGGRVYKYEDGTAIPYNKENVLMPYFIASGNVIS